MTATAPLEEAEGALSPELEAQLDAVHGRVADRVMVRSVGRPSTMSQTTQPELQLFIDACTYPGILDAVAVERHLAEYLELSGVEHQEHGVIPRERGIYRVRRQCEEMFGHWARVSD